MVSSSHLALAKDSLGEPCRVFPRSGQLKRAGLRKRKEGCFEDAAGQTKEGCLNDGGVNTLKHGARRSFFTLAECVPANQKRKQQDSESSGEIMP